MKNILIVVDMQNDFIDGSLGTKEAVAILPNVARKINEYRQRGDKIIFTADTHFDNYLDTNEGKHLPVKHCIKGTDGWKISPKLDVGDSKIIEKPTFGYLEWKNEIENVDGLSIELIGLCTDICVVSNALILKATFPSATIKVDSTCCAGVTPSSHTSALTTMQMCQIEVM
ncbi:MAG: cysteine hydrolase [Clostridiales bacterium]|nr:cysteine hydrolase [Clostridiales bacterium]